MISATVCGTLGSDSTVRDAGGTPALSARVATNRWDGKNGKVTDWVDVTLWGSRAAKLSTMLVKGAKITARGTMFVREWDTGTKKGHSLCLKADDIEITSAKRDHDAERPARTTERPSPDTLQEDDGIPF